MKPVQAIHLTQKLLHDEEFKSRHRTHPKWFTRERQLTFGLVMLLILQKTMKSIQLHLNEVFDKLGLACVSKSAFTQARSHLKHTAFLELNQTAIVSMYYQDDDYRRYQGFRLLAIDGSKIRLPDYRPLAKWFGTIDFSDGKTNHILGTQVQALASICYDVLNNLVVDSQLGNARSYEVDLARLHLSHTQTSDLLLCDRGYASYLWLAACTKGQRHFVVRCSSMSFAPARQLFTGHGAKSRVVSLVPSPDQRTKLQQLQLPMSLQVRFVRVILPNHQIEVLVTNLTDEALFPTPTFLELYHLRWGVETLYGVLKNRLQLENFSGQTVESVLQDFYATIFVTNLESLLTAPAQAQLATKTTRTRYPQQVNQAVSFNAIKNSVIALFYQETNPEELLTKLTQLFLTSPTVVRQQRSSPRRQRSTRQRLNYYQRVRKLCF